MRLIVEELSFKNTFSFGNELKTITLNSHATTLFLGENGSGKSSGISDNLSFVWYGRAHRNINKSTITNTINEKGAWVQVKFHVGPKNYRVIRGIKPNIFEIYENEVLIPQKDVKSYQEYLETNILRMNFKSFCQIVVLGKASFVPFMQLTAQERRTIIEDLLDIRVFSFMSDSMKLKVKGLTEEMDRVKKSLELVDIKITSSEKLINELNVSTEGQIQSHEEAIIGLKAQIEPIEKSILFEESGIAPVQESINKIIEEVNNYKKQIQEKNDVVKDLQVTLLEKTKIEKNIRTLEGLRIQVESNKDRTSTDFEFFKVNKTCPTCTQEITQTLQLQKKNEAETKIKEYNEGLMNMTMEIEKATLKLKKFDETQTKITGHNSEINSWNSTISKLNSDIQKLNYSIETIRSKIGSLDAQKITINNQIRTRELEINKLRVPKGSVVEEQAKLDGYRTDKQELLNQKESQLKTKQVYDVATLLLKDNGIKARVIKQYIPVLNQLIAKYLTEMDLFVNFQINENFEEVVKSRYRDEFKYCNFSEGQKLKIDVSLLLAFRKVAEMRGGVSTNLLILDEVFDSSLDTQGVENLMKILKTLDKINLYVISHRSNDMIEYFDRTFKFSLKNNFSVIEEL